MFRSQQYSCSRFPGQCFRGLVRPSLEVRQREVELRGVSRSSRRHNIPEPSRKFDCRRDQHWFGNNRPNAVLQRPEDYRRLNLIGLGSAFVSFPMCRCVIGRPPKFLENGEHQLNSHRAPHVPGLTSRCSGSSNYLDLRRRNRREYRFAATRE